MASYVVLCLASLTSCSLWWQSGLNTVTILNWVVKIVVFVVRVRVGPLDLARTCLPLVTNMFSMDLEDAKDLDPGDEP